MVSCLGVSDMEHEPDMRCESLAVLCISDPPQTLLMWGTCEGEQYQLMAPLTWFNKKQFGSVGTGCR